MHSILTHAGVYLSLNGKVLADNDTIIINTKLDDNGSRNHGFLVCHTDKPDCCHKSKKGKWYSQLDDSIAQSGSVNKFNDSVTQRSDEGTLNITIAENDFTSPLKLCCTVPDATGIDWTVCTDSG